MNHPRRCPPKKQIELAKEWDALAGERHRQIASGDDISFWNIVVPTALALLADADVEIVLDIGCGTGDFTSHLSRYAKKIVAIEPSRESIRIAREVCREKKNVTFIEANLESAPSLFEGHPATAAVALMTLMTAPDLVAIAKALTIALEKGARIVAMITHPCFWPRYWGYESASWFDYESEIFIEAPFAISKGKTEFVTTHIHRPLSHYLNVFSRAGFRLLRLEEPMPKSEIKGLYPSAWQFPRFLGLLWEYGSVDND